MNKIHVIGAGLAGTEAAWQLARFGIPVRLYEMKPKQFSPAHHSEDFAELVCSNSMRSDRLSNAVGLLKAEMRMLGSLIMEAADATKVPAGGALAVDRNKFSDYITQKIQAHPLIEVVYEEVKEIHSEQAVIIAAGPLCSDALSASIAKLPGLSTLSFYDAAAPIVSADSIDMSKAFYASRYERGKDYINCPMDKEKYLAFVEALVNAQTAEVHGFEEKKVFEGCMPVESMAKRGVDTLAFGPMKPVGLVDPNTGKTPYAVVQLRCENEQASMYNIVGFQTRLLWGEQKRVFSMIPGLENAEFLRYGVMHRNTFLHSPGFLDKQYRVIQAPNISFAGQITGVEGYVESAASGLLAALYRVAEYKEKELPMLGNIHVISAMASYVASPNVKFQPMNANFGLLDALEGKRIRNKVERYEAISQRSLENLKNLVRYLEYGL